MPAPQKLEASRQGEPSSPAPAPTDVTPRDPFVGFHRAAEAIEREHAEIERAISAGMGPYRALGFEPPQIFGPLGLVHIDCVTREQAEQIASELNRSWFAGQISIEEPPSLTAAGRGAPALDADLLREAINLFGCLNALTRDPAILMAIQRSLQRVGAALRSIEARRS